MSNVTQTLTGPPSAHRSGDYVPYSAGSSIYVRAFLQGVLSTLVLSTVVLLFVITTNDEKQGAPGKPVRGPVTEHLKDNDDEIGGRGRQPEPVGDGAK